MLAAVSLELKAEGKCARSCAVFSVAFSPDGKTIVSGSRDDAREVGETIPKDTRKVSASIKVWDAGVLAWGHRGSF